MPGGVVAAEIYGLPAWGHNELEAIRDEARQFAVADRTGRGSGRRSRCSNPMVAGPPLLVPHTAGQLRWLAAQTLEGYAYRAEVDGVVAAVARSAKSTHTLAGGSVLLLSVWMEQT